MFIKLGAAIEFEFVEPTDISMTWPFADYKGTKNGQPLYEKGEFTGRAIEVTAMLALIDLHSGGLLTLQAVKLKEMIYENPISDYSGKNGKRDTQQ